MLHPEPDDIRTSILDYLAEHPDAEDTLEGITEWWLLDRCIRRQLPVVRRTLDELVADGVLVSRRAAGREPRYRFNPRSTERSASPQAPDDDPLPR